MFLESRNNLNGLETVDPDLYDCAFEDLINVEHPGQKATHARAVTYGRC